MEIPDELIASLVPAIEQQLESPETRFVKEAYDRLLGRHSCSEEEAKELLAQALAIVTNKMMTSGKSFDSRYYKELLAVLPDLPDESQ